MRRRSHPETLRDAAIGYAHQGVPVLPDILPHPAGDPVQVPVCTCRRHDCAALPLHPPRQLDQDLGTWQAAQVEQWWIATPNAAIATVAGAAFDVIELHTALRADTILRWLADQGLPPGPVLDAGLGRQQLLAAPDSYQPDRYDAAGAAILYLAAGALVLLPPSRLGDGQPVRWLRPLNPDVDLPDGRELFFTLFDLPATRQLADPDTYAFPAIQRRSRQTAAARP